VLDVITKMQMDINKVSNRSHLIYDIYKNGDISDMYRKRTMLEYEEIIDLKKGKLHSASCPVFRIAHKSSLEALTDVIT